MRTLCLGEALVDLICERPIASIAEADAFVPHFGGAVANVALTAARLGAGTALVGGAGDDHWGRWLVEQLSEAGVDLSWFGLVDDQPTPMALVTIDGSGEPSYNLYGDALAAGLPRGEGLLADAVEGCDALFLSSNTLTGEDERALCAQARERMLERGRPVIFDPNLRPHRWRHMTDAVAASLPFIEGALLVRCNATEAEALTGEVDTALAAEALVASGARMAVVSGGAGGAVLRGGLRADVAAPPARVISTVGAGDVLTGVLLARLTLTGYYPPAVAAALPHAVEAAARACERWGAV